MLGLKESTESANSFSAVLMVFKVMRTIGFELSTAVVRASSGGPS